MTPQDVDLIRQSFAKVVPIKEAAGRMFYDRLFATAPEVRPLFAGDIDEQARKLMDTLAVAVGALRDLAALEPTLRALGARHRGYGVEPRHYAQVGAALIWTLERGLAPGFEAPTRAAWARLIEVIARVMEPRIAAAT